MRNEDYLRHWGDVALYSVGLHTIMADRQIKRCIDDNTFRLDDYGNAKAVIREYATGKWFIISGGWGNDDVHTAMLGAACGDVVGSIYEWHNIKYKLPTDKIVGHRCHFTDDTVMTCAVAEGLRKGLAQVPDNWMEMPEAEAVLKREVVKAMQEFGRRYPNAGYGGSFRRWLASPEPQPYRSWGNGSAMRASYAGWVAQSLQEAEKLGEISASVTHNHPEGIKGAKAVAGTIFVLRDEGNVEMLKQKVYQYASQYYDLDFTLDAIRDAYTFDVSCQGSVPQAIVAFLEGTSFSDVLSNAISIGGDSDTIAAIAGSIAEAVYPIPQGVRGRVIDRLDPFLKECLMEAVDFAYRRLP